ncbi:MAG: class I adenylate-forming enzyme family protein, partial [Pseudolabrys sp.]
MSTPDPHPDLTAILYPTVVDMLHAAADRAPDRVALVHGSRRLTYRDYRNAVVGLATFLGPAVVGQGRVATVLPNSIAACVATFAVFAVGAQLVPLNPLYTPRELSLVLEDADVSVLIADASTLAQLRDTPVFGRIPRVIALDEIEAKLPGWMASAPVALSRPVPDQLGLLQYTGGTTGRAKGDNLTHRAMATNIAQRETLLPSHMDEERLLCVMPIFHSYGMTMGLFLAAYARGTLVLMAKFQRDEVFDLIAAERITTFPASPTILTGLMAHARFATADLSSLSRCYSGSAPLAKATIDDWMARTGAPIFEGYGQTEAGPILTYNTIGRTRLGSVGVALPLTEIEIVDTQDGSTVLPVGGRGEIRARGPQIMTGYRNLPE